MRRYVPRRSPRGDVEVARVLATWLVLAGMGLTVLLRSATAQTGRVSGEFGSYGELYGVVGGPARRPAASARLYLRPTFALSNTLAVSLNLMLSSESFGASANSVSPALSTARQQISQLGVSPDWGWGRADFGHFSPTWSPLTVTGVRVLGGGLTLNPGLLRAAGYGGRAREAVEGGSVRGSYRRSTYGGRIGVGRADASFLDVSFVRTWDDPSSFSGAGADLGLDPRFLDDPTVDPDTLDVGDIVNPLAVTPQENLVLAVTGRAVLLGKRLQLRGEVSGSAHSRDVRASPLETDSALADFPSFVREAFTPRIGSSLGLAYTGEVRAAWPSVGGGISYRRIEPGFTSLGVAALLNDQELFRADGNVRFGRRATLRVDGSRQHDNLIGQKRFTTTRDRLGGTLSLRPLMRWGASFRVNVIDMRNDAPGGDAHRVAYTNWILGTQQTFSLGRSSVLRNIGIGYIYRSAGDEFRTSSDLDSHAANLRVVLALARTLSVTPSAGLVTSRTGESTDWTTRGTYALSAQWRTPNGRWTTTGSLARSDNGATRSIQGGLNSRLAVTRFDAMVLSVRAGRYDGVRNPLVTSGRFDEFTLGVQWTRRFGGSVTGPLGLP